MRLDQQLKLRARHLLEVLDDRDRGKHLYPLFMLREAIESVRETVTGIESRDAARHAAETATISPAENKTAASLAQSNAASDGNSVDVTIQSDVTIERLRFALTAMVEAFRFYVGHESDPAQDELDAFKLARAALAHGPTPVTHDEDGARK